MILAIIKAALKRLRMRKIENIVLHCTATPQNTTVESIKNYWHNVEGWKFPGYHFLIEANGNIHNLLSINEVANGVRGHNYNSIHISYIGGVDDKGEPIDNRTPRQVLSQMKLLVELSEKYPDAKILGHRDFEGVTKACPSFDARKFTEQIKLS